MYICILFSDFLCFDMSLLLLTVTLRGVSNKHCLLPFFHWYLKSLAFLKNLTHNFAYLSLSQENVSPDVRGTGQMHKKLLSARQAGSECK